MGPAGPAGPQGPQGLQGLPGATGGLSVVAANGAALGQVISFASGAPTFVAMQDQGVWLAAPINPDGLVPMSFYALYLDATCTGPAYVPLDTNPAPLLRLLQSTAGETTAYFAGNPTAVASFQGLSPLGQPQNCSPTAGTGWDNPMLAGPLRSIDMTRFPAPYSISQQ
jgi:hypothetical protein